MTQARICEVVARCAGNNDAKSADFLILQKDEKDRVPDTPESLGDKLLMLTRSMGGQVVDRG